MKVLYFSQLVYSATPMTLVAIGMLWLLASTVLLALAFRTAIVAAWQEPILRAPVLILESDDWGYGPLEQANALTRICVLLAGFHDVLGRSPVMTLGVVLAGPDTDFMRGDACEHYRGISLRDPRLAPVRDAILNGVGHGIFALQLHGREHFWPDSVMNAARTRTDVREWLTSPGLARTETLAPALQSRWIDAARLPSRPLPAARAREEAEAEVRAFAETMGAPPEVAVPPTFVWTRDVESAWARAGVRVVVTPGRQSEGRDAEGRLTFADRLFFNGARGPDGLQYVVRDCYFEPSLGHTHEQALLAVADKSDRGRPALVEMHRMNFIGPEAQAQDALRELRRFIESVSSRFKTVRFMSTAELAAHYRGPSDLLETRYASRVHFFLRRLSDVSRLRKLALVTGAILPAWLVYVTTRPRAS